MKTHASLVLCALSLLSAGRALADCAADATVAQTRQSFSRGQQAEKSGDARAALAAYVAAQAYTCEANPVAAEAARRAAAVARPLGDAARARGDHAAAFDYYEGGGHFAAADRELLARLEASPDDASLYGEALRHVQYRTLPAFQANEAVRIAVTGPYAPDAALLRAVEELPARAATRLLAAENAAFDQAWYAKYVALVQERPENPADFAALQQYAMKRQAFQAAQRKDPLREPLQAIGRLRAWESQVTDPARAASITRQRMERAEARVQDLTRRFADAPELLEMAIDYIGEAVDESGARESRVERVRRQAEQLGDTAAAKQRYQLAQDYYRVAGADAKAEQAQARLQALAQARMQPAIAAMQRDAAALQAQFADPKSVAEMQRQAQEAQRMLKAGKASQSSKSAARSADELASELGM